ncbi:cytochrome P450 [Ktedonobacter sp. SOSP1-52]|uniref:cytochrome P450 n=1 Tax=Ktedonobacter sp. SOSP1-52 TaxID=2778366 RepID=UPI00191530FE|nr:cytochrome P450 [Ktedonobacter sp. SOSP1-52]GHO71799.1 cytochrome P450 [Ktedonobacter sp. SOSP1-52]
MSTVTEIKQLSPPPLAPGWPVVGNALAMQQDLVAFLVKQYQQLGPIFRVRALNQEFVILAGPEANIFVTQQGADKFRSHEVWDSFGCEFGAKNSMLAIDGPPHLQMRKLLKPAYSVGNLLADIPLLVDIAQTVVKRFQVGEEVEALTLFRLIVTEQLGRALANHAPGTNLQNIITTIRVGLNVHMTKQMPAFMLKLPSYKRAKQHYLAMGKEIVEEHRATERDRKDLVDNILEASQKPEYHDILGSEEQIIFASLGPFVAGLDTVANECTFMLYELLNHPEILAQCIEVADQIFSEGLPTQEQIRTRDVLHDAMMETLRLHSIAPVVTRTAAKDFAFAGHSVKEGQNVMLANTVSHFLPKFYPDPYTFDIGRYSEERKEHKQRGAYNPFGIGTHLCLGAGAAEAQIVLVIATLLHLARLEQVSPQSKLRVKNDPTPTFGSAFRVRFSEHRH